MTNTDLITKAKKIKLVIFDVDGVLTDGSIIITDNGEEIKKFYVHDGLGIKLLQQVGVVIGIISSRACMAVTHRMQNLGVKYIYQDAKDKLETLNKLLKQLKLTHEQVAFVGDDLPDLKVMKTVGLGIAVPNAHPKIREAAIMETQSYGGEGAAREVCEFIMQAQGTLETIYQLF